MNGPQLTAVPRKELRQKQKQRELSKQLIIYNPLADRQI